MTSVVRLLMVEDDDDYRNDLKVFFENPPGTLGEQFGVQVMKVEEAGSKSEAEALLRNAAAVRQPYDLMILDLGLPWMPKGTDIDKDAGFELVPFVGAGKSCETVVIQSKYYSEVEAIRKAAAMGVASFFLKPPKELFAPFFENAMTVYQKGRVRQENRWLALRRLRAERWLIGQTKADVADRLSRTFSLRIGQVLDKTAELRRTLEECSPAGRFDAHGPIGQALEELSQAAIDAADSCYQQRKEHRPDPGHIEPVEVEDLVEKCIDRLRDGIVFKRIALVPPAPVGGRRVQTSRREIGMLLEELLFNAINVSDEGKEIKVQIEDEQDGDSTVNVRVTDQGHPLDKDTCRRITTGMMDDEAHRRLTRGEFRNSNEERDVERCCSLSLAQQLAQDIGAWIEVTATDQGNAVILRIPSPDQVMSAT